MDFIIETDRLILRELKAAKTSQLISLWQDPKVQHYLGGPVSTGMVKERLLQILKHWEIHTFGLCSVWDKSAERCLGLCGLQLSDDGLELSYKFYYKYWGKGYAYESAESILSYAFNVLKTEEVIAITQSKNTPSIKLLGKLGMSYRRTFDRYNAMQSLFLITRKTWKHYFFICGKGNSSERTKGL